MFSNGHEKRDCFTQLVPMESSHAVLGLLLLLFVSFVCLFVLGGCSDGSLVSIIPTLLASQSSVAWNVCCLTKLDSAFEEEKATGLRRVSYGHDYRQLVLCLTSLI